MEKRALVIVLDSLGCGGAPDAAVYGDAGANTLGHLFSREPDLELPALASIGLYEAMRLTDPVFPLITPLPRAGAAWGVLTEVSPGKDSTTGHWELMGAILAKPFATFETFPQDLVREIEQRGGVKFIGNVAASGTAILGTLGPEHLATGKPILYTSADSVLQIAAHEDPAIFGLERLQSLCLLARQVLDERGVRIGRVISRPFTGDTPATFQRTSRRHDYSLPPPPTTLNRLQNVGVTTITVGKIHEIFAGSGIDLPHSTGSNAEGMAAIERLWHEPSFGPQLIFANLVDFDTLHGHRRDPAGYARALRDFDRWLGGFLGKIGPRDLLVITGDHGNDPYHRGTDHTRERVPLMVLHGHPAPAAPISGGFGEVSALVERHLFPVNPLFFQTVFTGTPPDSGWPDSFAIITAHNPRSNPQAAEAANSHADLELHRTLADRGLQPFRITGGSPDGRHREPGWAFATTDFSLAAELSGRFDQVAFFRIEHGHIFIQADAGPEKWPVAPWSERFQS